MSPFEELLNKVYDGDPDKAAEDMMSAAKLSKYQRELFGPSIRWSVSQTLNNAARRLEAVAAGVASDDTSPRTARTNISRHNAKAPLPEYAPPAKHFDLTLPELRSLLPVEFALGGRRVTWADATINDHRAAETARRTVARGHLIQADKHAQAIKALERSGCDTLGELFTRQAAA